jgi:putative chitinase
MIRLDQLHTIMPGAKERAALFLEPLNAAMARFEIDTLPRAAAFLAQVAHESGQLRYVSEIASGKAYEKRIDLGNTDPAAIRAATRAGTTPGPFYKGHGLIQITGYFNHRDCGRALGLNLVDSPILLCEPEPAALSAGWYWSTHDLNWLADRKDFVGITQKINGGTNGLKDRVGFYVMAQKCLSQ